MWSKKESKPLVQFVSTLPGLSKIEECLPRPTKAFIPTWWKNMPPNQSPDTLHMPIRTVKMCPSFPDYFSQGYVIPLWSDVVMKYDKVDGVYGWRMGQPDNNLMGWDVHSPDQFLNYVEPNFQGLNATFTFKALSPWRIITPPGYSVLQLPVFYHFNKDISVLPGVIHTDIHHETNQQVLYHGNGKEIVLKRGTPFVQYIPFKRTTTYEMTTRDATPEDQSLFQTQLVDLKTQFSGAYNARRRAMDKALRGANKPRH